MSHATDPLAFEAAKAHFLDGLAQLQAGRAHDAEAAFRASLRLVPGRVSTLVNLTAAQLALGRAQDALATAAQVLAAEPRNADACYHRAQALRALGRRDEAVAAYDTLLALRPELATAWCAQAETLLDLGRPEPALQAYDRALALDATLAPAWLARGDILRDMHRLADARHAYEQARAHGADAQLCDYCLAALGAAADQPSTAPRAYVQALFDGYAGDFEQHVVQVLRYRAPEVLVHALDALHPLPFEHALDLGCGTGLCGPLLSPRVKRLTGVDLSEPMLDRARALKVYDELVHADITEHLRASRAPHDLVIAADVFIYVGDLAPVFEAVATRMPPGGVFCFSAEQPAEGHDDGYALQPSLRYAHGQAYVRGLAQAHGFDVMRLTHEPVREDQRRPVEGMFVHLRRR